MSEPARGRGAGRRAPFEVVVGGIVGAVRSLKTRKGDRMAAFPLDDPNGRIEVVAFPETFAKAQALIETDTMVLVKGKFERDDETMRLLASEIVAIDAVRERAARVVTIRLAMPPHGRETIEALAESWAGTRATAACASSWSCAAAPSRCGSRPTCAARSA